MTTSTANPQDTRIINSNSCIGTVAVSMTAYVVAELIHHGLMEAVLLPWLLSMGLSASMAAYLVWASVALSIMAMAWIIWKFLIAKDE